MQHFLLYSLVVSILTILVLVIKYRSSLEFSISLNAAKHIFALLWLAIGIGTSLLLCTGWYFGWLAPVRSTSFFSDILFCGIIVSFAVAIVVPDVQGVKRKIHRGFSYVAVFLMPALVATLMPLVQSRLQPILITVIGVQLIMIYLLLFVRRALQYLLQAQVVYLALFFAVLLIVTYAK